MKPYIAVFYFCIKARCFAYTRTSRRSCMRSAYKAVWGVLCLLFLAVPAVSSAESYDGSQFLLSWSESPSHSQTITWHSPSRREGYVQYNKSGGELSGQHQVKAEITDVGETGYYRYEAVLKGLSHNTTYDYRVGNGSRMESDPYLYNCAGP